MVLKWAGSPQVPTLQYFQIEIHQIWPNLSKIILFPKMGMSKKSRHVNFWKKKRRRPSGRDSQELFRRDSFWKLTSIKEIHFPDNLKKCFSPKRLWLMEIYRSKSKFYWKPKWSVWSIWTYSTGWIFKLVTQKLSFWRKLKIEEFEKLKIQVLGSKMDFWGCFQDQNDF